LLFDYYLPYNGKIINKKHQQRCEPVCFDYKKTSPSKFLHSNHANDIHLLRLLSFLTTSLMKKIVYQMAICNPCIHSCLQYKICFSQVLTKLIVWVHWYNLPEFVNTIAGVLYRVITLINLSYLTPSSILNLSKIAIQTPNLISGSELVGIEATRSKEI